MHKFRLGILPILLLVGHLFLSNQEMRSQDTFFDNFNAANYNRNNGNRNWNGAWVEGNDGGTSPTNGRIRINNNQLRFRNLDNAFIRRAANLALYEAATLTFSYNRTNGNEDLNAMVVLAFMNFD